MNASRRRMVTAAVAVLIVITGGLVIRNCGAKPELVKIKSGQTRSVGEVKWQVVSVMKVKTIEPSGANLQASGWFLIVDLYLTNLGKDKIEFDPESLTVTDSTGKAYPPHAKATATQVKVQQNPEIKSIYNTTIDPGKTQRLAGAFEIGEVATKLQLKVLGKSYGSNQDLVIELGF